MNEKDYELIEKYFDFSDKGNFTKEEWDVFREKYNTNPEFEEHVKNEEFIRRMRAVFMGHQAQEYVKEKEKRTSLQTALRLNFDFSIVIDALEKIESYFDTLIPNRYAYSFVPNFVSEGANEDVLFRVREAEMDSEDLVSFFKFLEEESGKRLLLVFGDGKVLLNVEDDSQVSQVLTKLIERSTSFKIEFSD